MKANFNLTQKLDMDFKEKQSNNFPQKNCPFKNVEIMILMMNI
jgi:hypothetical protein